MCRCSSLSSKSTLDATVAKVGEGPGTCRSQETSATWPGIDHHPRAGQRPDHDMVIAGARPESLATAPRVRHGTVLAVFTAALLSSATVLFVAEPMTGRLLLPRAGSTPAVWITSLDR